MRMNRGTVMLLVVSVIVIVAVLAFTIYQAAAPGDEDVVENPQETDLEQVTVPLFPGVDSASVLRLEVRDNTTGQRTVFFKQDDESWGMQDADGIGPEQENTGIVEQVTEEPFEVGSTTLDVDEAQITTLLAEFLRLEPQQAEAFEAEDLEEFGLSQPAYTVFALADTGAAYVLYVGDRNPAGTRYYTVVEQIAPGETSPNLPDMQVDLDRLDVETSLDAIIVPGNVPTVHPALEGDAGVIEMQQTLVAVETDSPLRLEIAATYSAIIEARNAEVAAAEETAIAGGEAQPAGNVADASPEAVAQDVERPEIDTSGDTGEAIAMATEALDSEAGADDTLAEAPIEPVAEAEVRLEGPQTVYLLPVGTIDALIALLTEPPVVQMGDPALETPAPTLVPIEVQSRDEDEVPLGVETVEATAEDAE